MKKTIIALILAMFTITASAQFEIDKKYISASLSGLNLNYNGSNGVSFGVNLKGGYFIEDKWMINANIGFDHAGKNANDSFNVGVGGRYYIIENGIFLGAKANLLLEKNHTDLLPGIEIGYAFFINDKVTIEPSIYYNQSFNNHKDYSNVGLSIGLGLYI